MMKLVLFSVIVILFSLIGSIHGADVPGNYPLRPFRYRYGCAVPGDSDYCVRVCRKHGVRYGYCWFFTCWCEYLEDKNIKI
uniref:Toxin-like peptide AaF1CA1 n=1 Tax=Androctonus australis TaxID=6858 RepID=TXA1_ANDAU|nr:RecName: Full=Toxin-like peptide AaF1CA1; Flags: Precursor [Androctonus australis]CAH03782.1 toxin-like peptide AaF1CA1 [Androctonus australis]